MSQRPGPTGGLRETAGPEQARKVTWLGPSDTACAYYTPRISLVEPRTPVSSSPHCSSGGPSGGYQGWVQGGYWEGGIPGWEGRGSTQLGYCQGPRLVLPGPNHCQAHAFCAQTGTPGPSWALRTPVFPALRYCPPRPIRARFQSQYTKVSQNGKVSPKSSHEACHSPYIKKEASKVTTLNFQISGIAQPSLTRNKWSCFGREALLIVKTAKCHQNVHLMYRSVTARIA